ncbi:hypothetical protein [Conexibacter sp. W3-3-2]|uniref:hypothetical protein n=1 Tax=Conexibacter sp. W3-3-2 TaxID=2675227 RepID=UPI001E5BE6D5|nr:hypothetical protein [Conexibacter sp. W3-3-2]
MSTATVDLSQVDLGDFDLWDPRPPYELFAQMRREAPLHWSPLKRFPEEGGSGRSRATPTSG